MSNPTLLFDKWCRRCNIKIECEICICCNYLIDICLPCCTNEIINYFSSIDSFNQEKKSLYFVKIISQLEYLTFCYKCLMEGLYNKNNDTKVSKFIFLYLKRNNKM